MEDFKEGLSKFRKTKEDCKINMPTIDTKTMKIKSNEGQTMVDKKFQHASKPWKPKGRK